MCGILAVFEGGVTPPVKLDRALELLSMRGPDSSGQVQVDNGSLKMFGFVLNMQDLVRQPLQSAGGDALCFNGELYIDDESLTRKKNITSDTVVTLNLLCEATSMDARVRQLDELEGEWSLIFYDASCMRVMYCRDSFGRRSLLEGRDKSGNLVAVSSVAFDSDHLHWTEVNVTHGYVLDLKTMKLEGIPRLAKWKRPDADNDLTNQTASESLLEMLKQSIKRRIKPATLGPNGQFSVLFSGGIDSVVIAAIAHLVSDDPSQPITLINISFNGEESPDRQAARSALTELKHVFPNAKWSLICRDISLIEVKAKTSLLVELLAPKISVMDFNLACVFHFASESSPTHARAVLSGLGADELFGGYSRHRAARTSGGPEALRQEMELDLDRLWTRNLGRDDRAISANGKELRVPFLDSDVVQLALELCAQTAQENGLEDKKIVRDMCRNLGLPESAGREKRAAQFGSRMAKLVKSGRTGKGDFDISSAFGDES